MQGELQAFKVGRVVRNRTFIYRGLTVTWFFIHPTLKACNSLSISYYFKWSFVLHSSEVIFTSDQKAIEIEIAFFIPLGIPRVPHWIISFMLHISVITSLINWSYIDELVEIFLNLSMKTVQVRLYIWTTSVVTFCIIILTVYSAGCYDECSIKGSIELTHGSIYSVTRKSNQSMALLKWLGWNETSYNYFIMMPFISVYIVNDPKNSKS